MLDLILAVLIAIAKSVFFFFIVPYLLYHRVYDYYRSQAHYKPQKIAWSLPGFWGSWPIIGNALTVAKA